jgi:Zn-dependent protease with chaperone function
MRSRDEFPSGPLLLYVVTTALEAPVIVARYVAIYVAAAIALKATGNGTADASELAKLAVAPALWSAVALVSPAGGGWWWRQQLGGREPSKREHMAYRAALEALEAGTMLLLPEPKQWFVVDESEPDAAVCGDTLMLTRGLLEGPGESLSAMLAHELGHLRGMDARLTAALNRLVIGRVRAPRRLALLRGGLALRLTAPAWGQVWREGEYEADRFAARIGWGGQLADFLEAEQLKHDHPIPLVGLTGHTHPPAELRIEALRALAKKQPQPPPRAEPEVIER